jgi:hypothetical protein
MLIKQDDVLRHPLVDGLRPHVLQYVDDMLIIMRVNDGAAARLKRIFDDFTREIGLVINFSKSTMIPMGVDEPGVAMVAASLGCTVEGFPQTYLGLPLSCEKLMSGWRALLLSLEGRLVLVNDVLDSLPTHAMTAMLL